MKPRKRLTEAELVAEGHREAQRTLRATFGEFTLAAASAGMADILTHEGFQPIIQAVRIATKSEPEPPVLPLEETVK